LIKRGLDILTALVALLVLWPLMVGVAILVRVRLGSPVLFRQRRPGRGGELFELIKFRSMSERREADGRVASDEARLTPFGRWLRSTSLDELPTLWNVLRGDMSLVGPRPLLPEYLPLYDAEQARRHEVRPGVTGWAQVNGRNALEWNDRFRLDVWYVDNRSLALDLLILWRTVSKVWRRDGIESFDASATPRFAGNAVARVELDSPIRRDDVSA